MVNLHLHTTKDLLVRPPSRVLENTLGIDIMIDHRSDQND